MAPERARIKPAGEEHAMKIAIGFKAHSGWTAAVALGLRDNHPWLVERQRLELVEARDAARTRQPYHAAAGLPPNEAQAMVRCGIEAARRVAAERVDQWLRQLFVSGHNIAGCAVLTGSSMPAWTTEQILAVHIRMHKAEGVLFPDALASAITTCGIPLGLIPEAALAALTLESCPWLDDVATLGKWAGPPWGADQKHAALAALVAFGTRLS
jgi:hypothetical protein